MGANLNLLTLIQLLYTFHCKEHIYTLYTNCWCIKQTCIGTNTECDISPLIHATVFQTLWAVKCSVESAAAVCGSIFEVFTQLAVVCATALVVHWNYIYTFVQEGADLKVCDVYDATFPNISSAFNKAVSIVLLIKEGSDVNIRDFG